MKRILILLSLMLSVSMAYAVDIWKSTNTATADTTKSLCNNYTNPTRGRGMVHNVCVNTGAAGSFSVFNASAAAVNPVAVIDTTAKGCTEYDVFLTSGVTYTNSATANVTMTYSCN